MSDVSKQMTLDHPRASDARALLRRPGQIQPFHLLVPVAVIAALLLSIHPVADPDVYWHVRLGGEILHHHRLNGAGWSFVPPDTPWRTPEWLSEVTLYGAVKSMGWRGIIVFQVVLGVVLLSALAALLVRGRDVRVRAAIFAVCAVSLATYIQARPQTISLILLVWVAKVCRDVLVHRRLPSPIVFGLVTLAWAQLHGLWILGPAALALAVLARVADDHGEASRRFTLRGVAIAVAGLAAGCVNPLGPRSLLLPFKLHSATHFIAEWRPTTFTPYFTWGLLVVVGALAVSWSRRGRVVPRSEIVWTGVWFAFALMAYRNVPVSVILLAPIACERLAATDRQAAVSSSEERHLRVAVAMVAVAALAVALIATLSVRPVPAGAPTRLAAMLNDGTPHRVLDDYNLGGILLAFGGPHVQVAVDGRADYYGADYLRRYQDLMAMHGNWQPLFNRLDADAAVIGTASPLHGWLLSHGWRQESRQGIFALLVRS